MVGYLSSERGVGEAGRQILSALETGSIPLATIDSPTVPDEIFETLGGLGEESYPYDFNLICVNADMLPVVATALGPRFFEGRHSTGLWFWEVSHFPSGWHRSFDYVDEVWVASEHIAEALRSLTIDPRAHDPPARRARAARRDRAARSWECRMGSASSSSSTTAASSAARTRSGWSRRSAPPSSPGPAPRS